jgi:PAS domain S-box-containing protein
VERRDRDTQARGLEREERTVAGSDRGRDERAVLSLPALESILRALREPALIFGAGSNLLAMNSAALEMVGLPSAEEGKRRGGELGALVEMRGPNGRLLSPEESPEARAARGESVLDLPLELRRRDTGQRWRALANAVPLSDAARRIAFAFVLFQTLPAEPLPDRPRPEPSADHFEAASAGTWRIQVSSGNIAWSERGKELFNLPGETVSLGSFLAALHPDDRPRIQRAVADSLRDVGSYDEEMRVRSADGSERWVECLGRAAADESGKAAEMKGIALDVTRRKRAEAALRASEEKLRLALDAAQMGTWDLDVARSLVTLSQRTQELFRFPPGAPPKDLESFLAAVHPDDRERVRGAVSAALEQRASFDQEMRVSWPGEGVRWIACKGRAFLDEAGMPARMAGTAVDITATKRAEEALREADERKSEFLAVLSHELRNPLAPIKNSLYLLGHLPPGASGAEHAKAVIDRQVDHLSRLVDDLLDLTRISRNRIELRPERLDLAGVVRATVEDHRSLFDSKGIRLETALSESPVAARADPTRVAQIVGNLLQNAAKFTPRGGLARVSVAREADLAVIRVADTGMGMTPEVLARLFQPFMQPDMALDRGRGGLGLGLALVKGLVELQGGEVSASSPGPGQGSELVVRLPLDLSNADQPHPGPSGEPGRRRILLIEDNVDAADSLRDLLAMEGHEVDVAYDGPSGIARAHELRPQVIFCDIGLPGMDGYEVAHELRTDESLRGSYLVALSGYALPEDIESAKSAGFDQHMAKPPRLEQIEELLSSPSKGM